MPDRPPPRSLEDDARFLARLHDLERGLGAPEGRHHGEPSPRARDIPGQWADRAPAHEPEDDGIGFLTDAIFEGHETVPPPAGLPRARRPLLDLFPAAPAERESALIHGAAGAASVIDSGLVDRAAADLGRAIPGAAPPAMARRMVLLLVLMALMLVGAAAAAWVFRDAANRAFSQWLHVPPAPAGNLPGRPPI